MPDDDFSSDDYLELYQFLLKALDDKGFVDFRSELEIAATVPVFEEGTDEEDRILKELKADVGQRALRRREPSEVFLAAMDTVWTRLTELPRVIRTIEKHLDVDPHRVEFRVEYQELYSPRQSEVINLGNLQPTEDEHAEIFALLMSIRPPRNADQLEWYGNKTGNQRRD